MQAHDVDRKPDKPGNAADDKERKDGSDIEEGSTFDASASSPGDPLYHREGIGRGERSRMTSILSKPRRVKCEIIMWAKPKHLATARMQSIGDLAEDLIYAYNHQFSDKIDIVIDWPEDKE